MVIEAGRCRALAVLIAAIAGECDERVRALATESRYPAVPDVPTFDEAGVPDFKAGGWIALVGPAGMPRDIMRLNREVVRIVATPEVARVYAQLSLLPATGTPEQLGQRVKSDLVAWGPVVKSLGISLE